MGVRKNQATLITQEKQNFVNALLALKANGTYDQFVQMHIDAMAHATPPGGNPMDRNAAHRGPTFLPWHREYLRRFELELQAIDSSVSIPYWDWTVDNSPSSSIWNNDLLGGDGQGSNDVVQDGPFAHNTGNWNLSIDGPALRRTLGRNSPPLPTTGQVNDCLAVTPYDSSPWNTSSNQNSSFRNRLEGWRGPGAIHNRGHVWVGGSMLPGSSPNDPAFFLHHCNVDRLWAVWQNMHLSEGYLPASGGPLGHNLNDPMFPWGGTATPTSVWNHIALGYTYDTDPPITPTPTPTPTPPPTGNCFIATAAYGSELSPPVQFLREFRDDVVLKSRFQKPFEDVLNVYYKFSPPVAELMKSNKSFKYAMKYSVVWPFVAVARATAFAVEPFAKQNKQSEKEN